MFAMEQKKGNCSLMDRRVRKTRQALQEALITLILERGYEALTVQDILDRANVGRSTFYAHFYDLEDLLQSEFEVLQAEFEQHIAQAPQQGDDIWAISRLMFQHAQAYRRLYQAVVGKSSEKIIQTQLKHYLSLQIRAKLQISWGKNDAITLDMLENYLVTAFMGLLKWWLDKDLPYTAAQIAQIYQDLCQDGLAKYKDA